MDKIVIVEDDEKLRKELQIFLNRNGYECVTLEDWKNIDRQILERNANADLVLLDINLPEHDGQYICRELRKESDIPIIMITSRNTEMDELISMNCGADDFVAKPFNTQILLAKIAAILKRTKQIVSNEQINVGEFLLDIAKGEARKEARVQELTKNELKILSYLVKKKGQIVSRDEIMDYLWDSEMFVDDNTLTVNINRLRKKLEEIGVKDAIETRRGQGYILR